MTLCPITVTKKAKHSDNSALPEIVLAREEDLKHRRVTLLERLRREKVHIKISHSTVLKINTPVTNAAYLCSYST